jgi:hypothetical protein
VSGGGAVCGGIALRVRVSVRVWCAVDRGLTIMRVC